MLDLEVAGLEVRWMVWRIEIYNTRPLFMFGCYYLDTFRFWGRRLTLAGSLNAFWCISSIAEQRIDCIWRRYAERKEDFILHLVSESVRMTVASVCSDV